MPDFAIIIAAICVCAFIGSFLFYLAGFNDYSGKSSVPWIELGIAIDVVAVVVFFYVVNTYSDRTISKPLVYCAGHRGATGSSSGLLGTNRIIVCGDGTTQPYTGDTEEVPVSDWQGHPLPSPGPVAPPAAGSTAPPAQRSTSGTPR